MAHMLRSSTRKSSLCTRQNVPRDHRKRYRSAMPFGLVHRSTPVQQTITNNYPSNTASSGNFSINDHQGDMKSIFTTFMLESLKFQKKQDIYLGRLVNAQIDHGKVLNKIMLILNNQTKTLEEIKKMLKEGNENQEEMKKNLKKIEETIKKEKIVEKADTNQVVTNENLLSRNKKLFYKESPV
ncbi:hypothetical protein I4U23_010445 [Adineta vaga]|nr:hypothetical protein I4U23_010445 [Adineta vaga]